MQEQSKRESGRGQGPKGGWDVQKSGNVIRHFAKGKVRGRAQGRQNTKPNFRMSVFCGHCGSRQGSCSWAWFESASCQGILHGAKIRIIHGGKIRSVFQIFEVMSHEKIPKPS